MSSLFLRLYIYNVLDLKNDPWSYRFFPTELMFFLLGSISYRIYAHKGKEFGKNMQYLIFVSVASFIFLYYRLPDVDIDYFPFSLKEILHFTLFIFAVPIIFSLFKRSKFDRLIGELSYPIYLIHMFVAVLCWNYVNKFNLPEVFKSSLFIATISILLSLLLVHFITNPIEKYRQRRLK